MERHLKHKKVRKEYNNPPWLFQQLLHLFIHPDTLSLPLPARPHYFEANPGHLTSSRYFRMWVLKIKTFFLSRTPVALSHLKKNQNSFIISNNQLVLVNLKKGEVQVPES